MNKEFLYQNKKIYCRITGIGKPVVLIHGFGEDGEVWKNQVVFLKDNFQLIIPDLPGSGKSELIDDMSIEGMTEVISFIMQQEQIDRCTIIGHSMGGYITLAFAEKYPTRLNAFGLFHSTSYPDNEDKKMGRQKGIEFINQQGALEFLKTATPKLFSAKTKEERPELIEGFIATLHNFSQISLVSYYKAMMRRPDRTETLKKSRVPVLFMIGEYDTAVPMKDMLQLCSLPEISYIHMLHKSGHMGMLEETGKSNRALKDFLLEI